METKVKAARLGYREPQEAVIVDDDDDDCRPLMWPISFSCLFVMRGWRIGISILPSKWVWEPKNACDR
jgi:hypothetical protein